MLAKCLRRTAGVAVDRDPVRRRLRVLLPDRVAAVRSELLELADLLERADDPDPAPVAEVRALLTDGCRSPLYNRDVHVSELRATLYYLRAGLSS
jgi:hypothetical protein